MATTFPVRAETQPAIRDIDQLIAALRKTGKEAGMTEKEIDDMVKATRKAGTDGVKNINSINQSMGGLNNTITKVGAGIVALFAVDRMKAFVGSVVEVTAEFEKLEAVLTNTLGSRGQAQRIFTDIQKFAKETPFSVLELTNSFVKLTNQGFKPTIEQLRKLGDLASSTGKSFDQLSEAIIDAQTGEFERLKDFGVRASKEGEKVTFTFKGVKTQVDFTNDSIRNYILSLGELEGVSGAAAAISKTLGGQINNLSDSWNTFLNTIGSSDAAQTVSTRFLNLLSSLVDKATVLIMTDEQQMRSQINEGINAQVEAYKNSGKTLEEYISLLEKQYDAQYEVKKATDLSTDATQDERNARFVEIEITKGSITAIKEYNNEIQKTAEAKAKAAQENALKAAQEAEILRVKELKKVYAELNALTDKVNDDALSAFNKAIQPNVQEVLGAIDPTKGIIPGINPDEIETEKADDLSGLKTVADIEREKQELRLETYQQAVSLVNSLTQVQQAAYQADLQMIQYRYQEELKLAGDNTSAREKISKEFQRKQFDLQNKQMQAQNLQSLFNIISSQGPAIAKTLGEGGAFSLPLALSLLGVFGSLIATQRKIQIPKFKDGVFGLNGPGTETSDSIPAWLSRNESVVPAERSKHFKDLLKPMIENDQYNWHDVKRIVDLKLPEVARPISLQAQSIATEGLERKLDQVRKSIESQKGTKVIFDENGFELYLGKKDSWSKQASKRYSM